MDRPRRSSLEMVMDILDKVSCNPNLPKSRLLSYCGVNTKRFNLNYLVKQGLVETVEYTGRKWSRGTRLVLTKKGMETFKLWRAITDNVGYRSGRFLDEQD